MIRLNVNIVVRKSSRLNMAVPIVIIAPFASGVSMWIQRCQEIGKILVEG